MKEFSEAAGLSAGTCNSHLDKQLDAAVSDIDREDDASRIQVEEALAYARCAKVSIAWLLTGKGGRLDWPYGEDGVLHKYPEKLRRAARALIELDDLTVPMAEQLVASVYEQNRTAELTSDDWLQALKVELRKASQRSGLRPSTKLRATAKTK